MGAWSPGDCWARAHVGSGQCQKWCKLWRLKAKAIFLQQFINSLSGFLTFHLHRDPLSSLLLQCISLHLQEKFVGNPLTEKSVLWRAVLKRENQKNQTNQQTQQQKVKEKPQGYTSKSVTHAQKKLISGECQLSTSSANK